MTKKRMRDSMKYSGDAEKIINFLFIKIQGRRCKKKKTLCSCQVITIDT